ncbi:MAG: SDR family NAD(P)-dependent oxidoreductase [bacterium]|nr:SDR family NAD(P)-dependent oxidoreductase [bacterium]
MMGSRVAVVTGGAAGIGRGCALRLASDGYRVAVIDIDVEGGEEVAAGIRSDGGEAFFLESDVGEPDAFPGIVAAVARRWDGLHVLVNNAGLDYNEPLSEMTVAAWDRCLEVDLRSVALSAQAAADLMERSGGGSIVNIASVMARYTFPDYGAYTASKAGVIGLTRTLALELGPKGIRVNAIAPGFIDTAAWDRVLAKMDDPDEFAASVAALHAVGRRGKPQDIAGVVAFLVGDDAGFITGQTLVVDGGLTAQIRLG